MVGRWWTDSGSLGRVPVWRQELQVQGGKGFFGEQRGHLNQAASCSDTQQPWGEEPACSAPVACRPVGNGWGGPAGRESSRGAQEVGGVGQQRGTHPVFHCLGGVGSFLLRVVRREDINDGHEIDLLLGGACRRGEAG